MDHIGNDLGINNEIDKLLMNAGTRKTITEEDIELYVGVSKEYNVFELQNALCEKTGRHAHHSVFWVQPQSGTIQLVLPSLYNFSVKYIFSAQTKDEGGGAAGREPYFVKDYLAAAKLRVWRWKNTVAPAIKLLKA